MAKRRSIMILIALVLILSLAVPGAAFADFIDDGTGPTGEYYQYASFTKTPTSVYKGGGDVDAYGDLLYVNRDGLHLDVYEVTLLDTDGDGFYEPDQHLLNPDATGVMEQRTLTYLRTYDVPHLEIATVGEIYAAADRVYFLGDDKEGDIYEYIFATGVTNVVVDSTVAVTGPSGYGLSHLGYDDVNDKWYASYEQSDPSRRAVYSWDGSGWVFEFDYHSLAGGHSDGLEVITDPATNIPYVYVSDMTSDYIGQWRYDTDTSSWVEQNLFEYVGTAGDVEGMGFGALGHFWVTTGFSLSGTLYELGGGELGGFVPQVRELMLSPDGVTNQVGETHTVTATTLLNEEAVEGVEVTFTVTGAHSTSGTATTDAAGQCTFTYTGTAAGDDAITATATIEDELVTSNEVSKTWEGAINQPPVADANGPYNSTENFPIDFDASGSSDPDGDPLQFRWDFDSDGNWDTGWSPHFMATNMWCDDFSGTATVEVTDGQLSDTDTSSVEVTNLPPIIDVLKAKPESVQCYLEEIEFTGIGKDPGCDDLTVEWDFGDGNIETYGGFSATFNSVVYHTYDGSGDYTVTLTVSDDDGGMTSKQIEISIWDTTPPKLIGECIESVNPHGNNIPGKERGKNGKPKPNVNPDGFYLLDFIAEDNCDLEPQIWVGTADNPMMFLIEPGIVVKFTESADAEPEMKKIGSANGQADAVTWHIILPSDPVISAVDASGNIVSCGECLVPPPPM